MRKKKYKFIVLTLYPDLGIKVRETGYSNESEAYSYIGALRACETPYVVIKDDHLYAFEGYGMTSQELGDYLEKHW